MRFRIATYLVYFIFLLIVSLKLYRNPEYNWDMLPYMAVVLNYEGNTPQDAHHQVYQVAKKEIPANKYNLLTDTTNQHRKLALQQPEFFSSLYPMYVVKPMYTHLCWVAYKAGFGLTKSTYIISIIAYLLMGMLLIFWLSAYLKTIIAALLSAIVMLMPFMTNTAQLATPDMLSALLIFSGMYFLVGREKVAVAGLILILSVFTRIDNVIPALVLLTINKLFCRQNLSWRNYLLILAGILISFFYISSLATPYGFSSIYINSYINSMKQGDATTHLNIFDMRFLFSQLSSGLRHSALLIFATMGGLCLLLGKQVKNNLSWVIMATAICILTRFLLQPLIADRFFIPFYLLIIVVLLRTIGTRFNSKRTVNALTQIANSKL